jgi:hypothetical protein
MEYFDTRTAKGKKEEAEYLSRELATPPNLMPINWDEVTDWYYLASMLKGRQLETATHDNLRLIIERKHGGVPIILSNAVWTKCYDDHHSDGFTAVLQDYDEVLQTLRGVIKELTKLEKIRAALIPILSNGQMTDDQLHKLRNAVSGC